MGDAKGIVELPVVLVEPSALKGGEAEKPSLVNPELFG
jgi:hypothetical protein